MVWSIKNSLAIIIAIFILSSCEVYYSYFITVNRKADSTRVAVKVDSNYNLPSSYILANEKDYGNFSIKSSNKNFINKLNISFDTTLLQYTFTQSPGSTIWLHHQL